MLEELNDLRAQDAQKRSVQHLQVQLGKKEAQKRARRSEHRRWTARTNDKK